MKPSEILRYYSNEEVVNRLLNVKDRECAVRFGEGFGKRPMYFQYKGDIEGLVKSGATSFHVSEERWSNPLALNKDLRKEDLSDLRKAWDLLIDIDCKNVEISKIFCKMVVEKLNREGVKTVSVKFSGGSGFHVLVPYESFPQSINGIEINKLFPSAPMTVSIFLKNELRGPLKQVLEKDYGVRRLTSIFGLEEKAILGGDGLDPYKVIDIDTVLISERHMFRMQYSLNEKRWLVSVPIEKNGIDSFKTDAAEPWSVDTKKDFFALHPIRNEAAGLFVRAYDKYEPGETKKEERREYHITNVPLNKEILPPCIKVIDGGLTDGRKRSVFILTNFYRNVGKTKEEVLSLILEWNKNNKPPLKENLIKQQVEYAYSTKPYPPPNCDAAGYYKYFNVCFPNETCKLIKNPLSYYLRMSSTSKTRGRSNYRGTSRNFSGYTRKKQENRA